MSLAGFGEIAEKLRRSTVHLSAGRRGQGSGIIVSPDGMIVTNAHVATLSRVEVRVEVQLWDGSRSPADLLFRDQGRDLAILRVSRSGLPAAVLADSDRLRVGELVIAVGNPFGFIGALSTGVIHAIGRVHGLAPLKWIQADVQLAPGNSGGPLANAQGQVVGVNTMIAGGVGLAVPSNSVSRLLKSLAEATSSQAPLGVVGRPIEISIDGAARAGLAILEISKNSAAQRASLMPGDILIGIGGRHFETIEDFHRALDGVGERLVRIQFLRDHAPETPAHVRTVAVLLGLPAMAAA